MKIKVIYRQFPEEIKGVVLGAVEKQSGGCLILIDKERSEEEQAFTLKHELAHIALNHFENGSDLLGKEWEQHEKDADSLAERMTLGELMEFCENL